MMLDSMESEIHVRPVEVVGIAIPDCIPGIYSVAG